MIRLLTKLFPETTEAIWADGYAKAYEHAEQNRKRLAVAIRDLDNANWDFPKGTRREEAASLMIEQAAQLTEAFK